MALVSVYQEKMGHSTAETSNFASEKPSSSPGTACSVGKKITLFPSLVTLSSVQLLCAVFSVSCDDFVVYYKVNDVYKKYYKIADTLYSKAVRQFENSFDLACTW